MIRHFAALGLTTLIRLSTGFVLFVLIAREWGASTFGEFMYFFSLAALFVQVCEYGFGQQILRDIGAAPTSAPARMSQFLAAKVWLTVLTIAGSAAYAVLGGLTPNQCITLALLLIAAALMSYSEFLMACFRATGRYSRETVVAASGNALYFSLGLAALYWGTTPQHVALAFVVGRLLHFLITLAEYRRHIRTWVKPDFRPAAVVEVIKAGSSYGLNTAVGMVFINLDSIFISHVLGFDATGNYQAAARFYQGAALLPPIFAGVFLPKIAASMHDPIHQEKLIQRLNWSMLIVAVLGAAAFFLGPIFQPWIYPSTSLADAGRLLPWFGVLTIVSFYASTQGIVVTAFAGHRLRSIVLAGALVVLGLSAYPLLQALGTKGMIVSLILAYALIGSVFGGWLLKKGVGIRHSAYATLIATTTTSLFAIAYTH